MITIITASFNSQKTIKLTIESILNQTDSNLEYLIIDGGSTDKTIQIIKSFTQKFSDKNIKYKFISEEDTGIYEAWNKGVKMAQGEWVSFIGADDILAVNYIEIYSEYIKNNVDLDYISSKVNVIKNDTIIKTIDEGWNWNTSKRYMNVAHVGSLQNKKLYKKYGLYDESLKIAGDYEFLLRAKKNLKAGFINKPTVSMGADGISNDNLFLALKETKSVKNRHKTVSMSQSILDLYIAYFKGIIRNIIK